MPEIRRMGYLLIGLFGLTVLTAFVWKPAPPPVFHGMEGAQLPLTIDGYKGVDEPVDATTRSAIPSADIIQRQYSSASGSLINVTIIGGTGRNELHDPRSCLVGAGWQIQDDHVETLPARQPIPFRSCQAAIGSAGTGSDPAQMAAEDMLYVYIVNRKPVASASAIRWNLLTSDLLEQTDKPVYFVRTYADLPTYGSNSSSNLAEHKRLVAFTAALFNELSPVVDQGERS